MVVKDDKKEKVFFKEDGEDEEFDEEEEDSDEEGEESIEEVNKFEKCE